MRSDLPGDLANARQNQLLAALPSAQLERWWPQFEAVDLHCGDVLCESGSISSSVMFPLTAIVSLSYLTQDGATTECGVVGNDGMVGIADFMSGQATPGRAGPSCRVRARACD